MRIEIVDCEQISPEWFAARAGMPTASCFHKVTAKDRSGKGPGKTRTDYLYQLADEQVYGDPVEDYTNANMERGKVMEAEARDIYGLESGILPEQVGFVKNHDLGAGCSPDSFIGKKGLLQIKTSFPRLWVPHVIAGTIPTEHVPQCQGELLVTGREWLDLMIYWPKRKPHIVRIKRDEDYIRELSAALLVFNGELKVTVDMLRAKLGRKGAA